MDDRTVDISAEALDRRLRTLSSLYKLGLSLQKAKPATGPPSDRPNNSQAGIRS